MLSNDDDQVLATIKQARLVCAEAGTKRESLLLQIAQIDQNEAEAKQLLLAYEAFSGRLGTPQTVDTTASGKQRVRATGVKASIVNAALALLESGHPVPTQKIAQRLKDDGISIGATGKLEARISQILSADKEKRFVADRRIGWTLKK
ncbi:hypothetical protein YA0002_00565 [Pseudomonas cichorii]|uniref:hypothetical protein n=1 Tax=Pseudomonas cichorii TaxID=36746 RepID=UPI0018E60ECE|nr:hypothetical protein [Pseudomonas cichorii]MBI6851238.1 hypothetical protein [Pseudomonas cichorii]